MTREEQIEGNISIARFMGAIDTDDTRLIDDKPESLYELIVGNDKKIHYVENTGYSGTIYSPQHLQYHRDWNWLIPVAQKVYNELNILYDKEQEIVRNLPISQYTEHSVVVLNRIERRINRAIRLEGDFKIENFFNNVVESVQFIKWYNEQTNNKTQ